LAVGGAAERAADGRETLCVLLAQADRRAQAALRDTLKLRLTAREAQEEVAVGREEQQYLADALATARTDAETLARDSDDMSARLHAAEAKARAMERDKVAAEGREGQAVEAMQDTAEGLAGRVEQLEQRLREVNTERETLFTSLEAKETSLETALSKLREYRQLVNDAAGTILGLETSSARKEAALMQLADKLRQAQLVEQAEAAWSISHVTSLTDQLRQQEVKVHTLQSLAHLSRDQAMETLVARNQQLEALVTKTRAEAASEIARLRSTSVIPPPPPDTATPRHLASLATPAATSIATLASAPSTGTVVSLLPHGSARNLHRLSPPRPTSPYRTASPPPPPPLSASSLAIVPSRRPRRPDMVRRHYAPPLPIAQHTHRLDQAGDTDIM